MNKDSSRQAFVNFNPLIRDHISQLSDDINCESGIIAVANFKKQQKSHFFKVLIAGLSEFLKSYFINRNFKYGYVGYINSKLNSYCTFLQEAKLYEHYHKRPLLAQTSNNNLSCAPISVYVVTLNEESHIARALTSVANFKELIVVDSGSTDNTVDIAKSFGARIFQREWPGYAKQKQFALEQCHCSWVYSLDADESLTTELNLFIKQFVTQRKYNSLRTLRNDYFMGYSMGRWVKKPHNNRLFMKQYGQYCFSELAHENPKVQGREYSCKYYFNHYGYNDITTLVSKFNQYSSLKANERYLANKQIIFLKVVTSTFFQFLKYYLLHRYFLMGTRGLILSIIYAHYSFQKSAKLYTHHKFYRGKANND